MARPAAPRFRAVAAIGVVMIVLVVLHVPFVNGPSYWRWGWQRLPFWRGWPGVLLAAIPFALAQWAAAGFEATGRLRRAGAMAGLMIAAFVLELNALVIAAGAQARDRLWQVVEDGRATSYYSDALLTSRVIPDLREWFRLFPEFIGRLHIHARNKPPGSMLFYLTFAKLFPNDQHQAAVAAGVTIGLLATLSIPAVYFLARTQDASRPTAFLAASVMTLAPGFTLFFPELDQIYPAISAVLLGTWILALRRGSRIWALLCGTVLAGALFFTFNLLVLGWFMAATALYLWRGQRGVTLQTLVGAGAIVVGCVVASDVGLRLGAHYDVLATFKASVDNQTAFAANVPRPYPQTVVFDLLDYALGLGWMAALMFAGSLSARAGRERMELAFARIAATQLAVVAVGALLSVETARVWLFMVPLALPAVGRELARWSKRERTVFFVLAAVTVVLVGQNMTFFSLTPE